MKPEIVKNPGLEGDIAIETPSQPGNNWVERLGAKNDHVDVAVFITDLRFGGVQRVVFNLCKGLVASGLRVDLLVCMASGEMAAQVPDGVRIVQLQRGSKMFGRFWALRADPAGFKSMLMPVLLAAKPVGRLKFIRPLSKYLKQNRPPVLLANDTDCNLIAVWSRALSKVPTRLVLSAHRSVVAHTRQQLQAGKNGHWRWLYLPALIRRCYKRADAVVTVSAGVAEGLTQFCKIPAGSMQVIFNPVVTEKLLQMAAQPLRDDWVNSGTAPLLIGAGRIDEQKDFPNLLRAVAIVRQSIPVRVAILGEGDGRDELLSLAEHLGIADAVHLPGFVENPYAYMSAADVFVLSSRFEGLPTVLIEAIACGCAVVSTDCPSGPREILDDGKYGELVPVEDAESLAAAIKRTLETSLPSDQLTARANDFGPKKATAEYLRVLAGG